MIKNCLLDISLIEDEIFLHGSSSEDELTSIRGSVQLKTSNQLKVTSLHLTLTGTIKTNWSSEGRIYKDKVNVLHKEWILLPKQQGGHILSSGDYQYPFQGTLSSDLPTTIDIKSGKVEYKLVASLNTGNWWKQTQSHDLKLTRSKLPSDSIMNESVYATGSHLDLFTYQLSCSNRAFGPDDIIPINFIVAPFEDSSIKPNIQSISCLLKRTTVMKTRIQVDQWMSKKKEEILNISHISFPSHCNSINESLHLPVTSLKRSWPLKTPKFFPDTNNILMDVSHEVKARVILKDHEGSCCDILLKFPVTIMSMNRDSVLSELPSYHIQDTVLIESTYLPPSYRSTWCPMTRNPSLSSLPSYDEIIIPRSTDPKPSSSPLSVSRPTHHPRPSQLAIVTTPIVS